MEKRTEGWTALKRFLISRLSSLGDVVCSLPAATALKRGHPDCQVTWVVDRRFAHVVRACTSVDNVIEAPASPQGEFDAALDLQGLLKSAVIVARAKASQKLGFHWQREGAALFSRRVLPDPTSLHVVDQYVDVARAAGGVADAAEFNLVPDTQALASIKVKLGPAANDPFVVVNPGAAWASKRWPPEHIAKMVDDLDLPVVLIGSKGETGAREALLHSRKGAMNLTGETTIAELIALISLARAHVGGDTGSTHIAAALEIPSIGLYSSTRPERSCPYGQINRCLYQPTGLSLIAPEAVLAKVREALA